MVSHVPNDIGGSRPVRKQVCDMHGLRGACWSKHGSLKHDLMVLIQALHILTISIKLMCWRPACT